MRSVPKPDPFGRLLVERQLVRPQRETAGLGVRVLAWLVKVRGKRHRRPRCLPEGPLDSWFSSLSGMAVYRPMAQLPDGA